MNKEAWAIVQFHVKYPHNKDQISWKEIDQLFQTPVIPRIDEYISLKDDYGRYSLFKVVGVVYQLRKDPDESPPIVRIYAYSEKPEAIVFSQLFDSIFVPLLDEE